jgi:hypothetical protein
MLFIGSFGAAAYTVYYFFFMPNNTTVPAFGEGDVNLVIEGEQVVSGNAPKVMDNEILLPVDVIKKYIDPYIYWDEKAEKVTITTRDRVIRMKTDSLNALVNNKPVTLNIPAVEDKGTVFVPIGFLDDFYGIDITYLKENNVVVIDYKTSVKHMAEPISVNAVVRKGRSVRYPIIRKFDLNAQNKEENLLRIFEEYDKWYKVRTSKGEIGFIEKRHVVARVPTVAKMTLGQETSSLWKPEDGKINLVWDMLYGRPQIASIPNMEGLDIISPTWFEVKDKNGGLTNRANAGYVEWAHSKGYKVWALLSNNFSDVPMTREMLKDTDARDNTIREILAYAALYKLDGINIDFENLGKEDKTDLTQFVREIAPLLREQGLVVSMDINLLACYDRKALGEAVDYVALMAYDQHWKGGSEAGSVAQLSWVETIVEMVLKDIPKDKLLLGLPFYTRLWQEEPDGTGGIKLSSKVLSMEKAKETIKENSAQVIWDEESGQFYAEFKKDNSVFKLWLEDDNSINLKSSLVHKYKLAGTAAWRRSDETPDIWNVLNSNLKVVDNYFEWKEKNSGNKYVYSR